MKSTMTKLVLVLLDYFFDCQMRGKSSPLRSIVHVTSDQGTFDPYQNQVSLFIHGHRLVPVAALVAFQVLNLAKVFLQALAAP